MVRSRLGSGGWVAWNVGGDISVDVAQLQQIAHAPTVADMLVVNELVGKLHRYARERFLFYQKLKEPLRMEVIHDSAFVENRWPASLGRAC